MSATKVPQKFLNKPNQKSSGFAVRVFVRERSKNDRGEGRDDWKHHHPSYRGKGNEI